MDQGQMWTDERGKKVSAVPFLSRLYQDEEVRLLQDRIFPFTEGDPIPFRLHLYAEGKYEGGKFGKADIEHVVKVLLSPSALVCRLVGVSKEELTRFCESGHLTNVPSCSGQWFVDELVSAGYLREKWVTGVLVLFPTEHLLRKFVCKEK